MSCTETHAEKCVLSGLNRCVIPSCMRDATPHTVGLSVMEPILSRTYSKGKAAGDVFNVIIQLK